MTCARTALDSSDPGEYPEGWCMEYLNVKRLIKSIASAKVSMKELQYNFGVANVLVL